MIDWLRKNWYWTFPILIWGISWLGLGFNGLYGQDSHEYLRYSTALAEHLFEGAEHPGSFHWPIYFPLAGALLGQLTGSVAVALSLVSLLSLIGIAILLRNVLDRLYPGTESFSRIFTALFLCGSPLLLRGSMLVMSDMLGLFGMVLAMCHMVVYWQEKKPLSVMWVVAGAFIAVWSRYQMAVVLLPLGLWFIGYVSWERRVSHWQLAVITATAFLLPLMALQPSIARGVTNNSLLLDWDFTNLFASEFNTTDGKASFRFPNVIFATANFWMPRFGIALLIALLGFRLPKKIEAWQWPVGGTIALNLVFVAGLPFQNPRLLYPTFPLILVLAYPWVARGWMRWQNPAIRGVLVALVVLVHGFFFGQRYLRFYENQQWQQTVTEALKAYPEQTIYTFAVDQSFASYGINNPVMNLWEQAYPEFQSGALVLFDPEAFSKTWEGRNPMINWKAVSTDYDLSLEKEWSNGWKLWTINGPANGPNDP